MPPSANLSVYITPTEDHADTRDERIFRHLLQAIIDRRLKPGTRLPEDSLGDAFQVSRTIVRKALQKLALQRLVTITPNKGARIAQPSRKEAEDVFQARKLIEVAMIPAVYDNIESEAYSQLHQTITQEQIARSKQQLHEEIQLTARFHVQLAVATGNIILSEQVAQLTSISSLVISLYGSSESVGCPCGEHSELLALIEANKVKQAQRWMDNHLERIYQTVNTSQAVDGDVDFKTILGL